ncbi:DedA family protein [Candidatus Woesearchaeota archaeon]|nr:DedA family protein [Candidatus Woesearchaeota archaeon]
MIETLFTLITNFISFIGYLGVFLLMVLESMIFPVPSEAVMPFAGYLASTGRFDLFSVTLIASFGTMAGSLLSYFIGLNGEHLIKKYHRLFLLNEHHLELTKKFFARHGAKTIFISRFIPVVRHLISIPAGIGKMDIKKFIFFTFLGGFLWNFILAYFGFKLGENWTLITKYSKVIDLVIIGLIILVVIYYLHNKRLKKSSSDKQLDLQ